MAAGLRRAVLGQGCRRARGFLRVARCEGRAVLDKAAYVPVAVLQLLFVVVDDPVVQVVVGARLVLGQGC